MIAVVAREVVVVVVVVRGSDGCRFFFNKYANSLSRPVVGSRLLARQVDIS